MKELGVVVYGQRHKIIKGVNRYRSLIAASATNPPTAINSATAATAAVLPIIVGVDNLSISRGGLGTTSGGHFKGVGVHEPKPPGSDFFPAAAATETVFVDVPRDSTEFRDVEEQVSLV